MKAMAHLKSPLTPKENEVILTALNPIFDIQVLDLDLEKGLLLFNYNSRMVLAMVEKKLLEAGLPIMSYSFPNRIPLLHSGMDKDHGTLA
ncbi:hypothetical protein KCTC52924_00593 [Arenibacter antarcticus]|uniref:Uncharacterized protein n=1 Tax=Arenibacter antarcticus TaxID=2040469 RepID=A0ABW5VDP7_9FLAO|nr:hypothetical protein [Arenibacter sp. H213]MCM4169341.1 hypothetical protein [Arenibacter sp. H213]